MASVQQILALRKQLVQATKDSTNVDEALSILNKLKSQVVATDELLRETKIGITVNKLRSNENKRVVDLAKELVKKWKGDVGQSPSGSKKTTISTPSNAASPSPAPPPQQQQNQSPVPAPAKPSVEVKTNAVPAPSPSTSSQPAASDSAQPTSSASVNQPSTSNGSTLGEKRPAVAAPGGGGPRRRPSGGPPRTTKTDKVSLKGTKDETGDKTRDKCIELIYDALACDSDAPDDLILSRAVALERLVHSKNPPPDGTATYRNKMRSFYLNLKASGNPALREDVVSGEISVSELYEMDPKDMASEEQKAVNRRLVAENLFNAQGAAPQQAETDAFQCGKCKERRCMYYQMQTRSADEPMTTFVTCLNCNNRWKFS